MPSVSINGKSIFYSDDPSENRNSSKITLFIHGLGSSSCFYHTIIPQVRRVSRCIALDTPGSGISSLGNTPQSTKTITEDIIGLLDALNVQGKIAVVGHSMGGILASCLAVSRPDRVRGVVLIGPVNPNPGAAKAFEDRIKAVKKDGLENLARTIPIAATGRNSSPLHHAFIRSLVLGTSTEGYMSLCRVIATADKPYYEAITVPLLILAGGEDKTAPISGCQSILEAYGTSEEKKEIRELEGVGHWYCIEDPEGVSNAIETFIITNL